MRPEPGSSCLANMSAPPRSTVMLPRLSAGAPTEGALSTGSFQHSVTLHEVPVGPGGGRLLSHALCLARVELPTSVCAHLQVGYGAPLLTRPLGLARALVAIARHVGTESPAYAPGRAARLELDRVGDLPEGELLNELTSRLESIRWPAWVPRVGMVMPLGNDITAGLDRLQPPKPPDGIACPLLAAKVASAMRGPVFMRDAAPTLTHLLDLFGGATPSGTWELWLPVRPGTVRPLMPETAQTSGESP